MKKLLTLIALVVFALGLNFVIQPIDAEAAPAPAEDNAGNNGNNGNANNGNNGNNGNSENKPKGPGHNE